ncbi:acetyltransferase [Vitiosangium sp. GDMCC 1.1324]|nr:acetyltransferase [Vitiosangium sp. GDMCC 1.1324]
MSDLDISIASADERAAIANMMQLYTHDFSELWAGEARGELDALGRFPEYPLEPYWREPDHIPLLMRVGGHIAGFALLNRTSHLGGTPDRNMAEFFVARKHRRGGVGLRAAHEIFSRWPGTWAAAVTRKNVAAQRFWRMAVATHPDVADIAETDVTEGWNGPVLSFAIRPSRRPDTMGST